jgi:Protein of unknown function (DUF1648)
VKTHLRAGTTAAIGVVIAVLAVLPFALWWRQLPDPLAVHWSAGGTVSSSMSRAGAAISVTVPAAVCGLTAAILSLVAALASRTAAAQARLAKLAALAAALAAVLAVAAWTVALANHQAATFRQAHRVGPVDVLVAVVAAVITFAVVAWLSRVRPLAVQAAAASSARLAAQAPASVALAPGERGAWTGRAHLTWWLPAFLLAICAVLVATLRPVTAAVLPVAVIFVIYLAFGWIRVSIDWRGLRIHYGLLPWPVTTISLDRLQHAEPINLRPIDWGGWGYRGSRALGRSAVVLRGGEAIRLELADRGEFAVTVDDAVSGAGLLNDLLGQR